MTIQVNFPIAGNSYAVVANFAKVFSRMDFFTGAMPADTTYPDPNTMIAYIAWYSNAWLVHPMTTANVFSIGLSAPQPVAIFNSGTPTFFRFSDDGIINCLGQGTVSVTGGGGDVMFDNVNWVANNNNINLVELTFNLSITAVS